MKVFQTLVVDHVESEIKALAGKERKAARSGRDEGGQIMKNCITKTGRERGMTMRTIVFVASADRAINFAPFVKLLIHCLLRAAQP